MYALAQSERPPTWISPGRFGEEEKIEIESCRKGLSAKRAQLARPVALSLEANRYHSVGDLQPTEVSPLLRYTSTGDYEISTPTREEPQPLRKRQPQKKNDALSPKQLDCFVDFSPGMFRQPSSPPETVVCHLSRASSISEISFNEREWIVDDSSSGSESNSVTKHMVSAEDWEGIILAASCPEHEAEQPHGLSPRSSGLRFPECSHAPDNMLLTELENQMRYTHHGRDDKNTEDAEGRASDQSSGPEILDDFFHAPLSPPQRQPSLPPKSHIRAVKVSSTNNGDEIDLREFAAHNAHIHSSQTFGATHGIAEVDVTKEDGVCRDFTPSTTTSTLSASSFQCGPRIPEHPNLDVSESSQHSGASFPELMVETPHLRPEELCIEGLSDEEMLQMALQASQQDFDERNQIMAALHCESALEAANIEAGVDMNDEEPINIAFGYSLEALLALPAPQRPPVTLQENQFRRRRRGGGGLRGMLRLGRGGNPEDK
jgi:hypothetical protein